MTSRPSIAEGRWRDDGCGPESGQPGTARRAVLSVILRKSGTQRGFLARWRMISATASLLVLMTPMAKRRSRVAALVRNR